MAGLADPYAPLSRGMPMLLLDDAYGRLFVDYNHIHAGGQCGDVHALGVAVFAGYACYFGAGAREYADVAYSLGTGNGHLGGGRYGVDAQAVARGVTYAGCPDDGSGGGVWSCVPRAYTPGGCRMASGLEAF